jgi:hypothetical protein
MGKKVVKKIVLVIVYPEIRYLIYSLNDGSEQVLASDSEIEAAEGDIFKIVDLTLAGGNSAEAIPFQYSLISESGEQHKFVNQQVVIPASTATTLSLTVSCNNIIVGRYKIKNARSAIAR